MRSHCSFINHACECRKAAFDLFRLFALYMTTGTFLSFYSKAGHKLETLQKMYTHETIPKSLNVKHCPMYTHETIPKSLHVKHCPMYACKKLLSNTHIM